MNPGFKDYFSRDAVAYAQFRPRYPDALYKWLADQVDPRSLAWDAGTGNGQAAVGLAGHFTRVIGTDASAEQIASAEANDRVEYRVTRSEESGIPGSSVDLATTAQALHWFDRPAYFEEVRRVVRPGGMLAIWCYETLRADSSIEAVLDHFYRVETGRYWTKDRLLVENGYRSISVPFAEVTTPEFQMTADLSFEGMVGYVGTWSAVRRYRDQTGRDPMPEFAERLRSVWGSEHTRRIVWPLSVRAFRL